MSARGGKDTEPMIKTCRQRIDEYQSGKTNHCRGEKLRFQLTESGFDIYNITAPLAWRGESVLAGRVEHRDSEDSRVFFFYRRGEEWHPIPQEKEIRLQDPFLTKVRDQLILGGVEVFPHPEVPGALQWRTVFFRGGTIQDLKRFAVGPIGMKDIRLKELTDGRIFVFTRPQGQKGGRGRIGYTILDDLDALTPEAMENAPLIPSHFIDDEWGGVNEIHLLSNGDLGALGHIACFDGNGSRHYYSACFSMNYHTGVCTDMKVIASRSDFPPGDSKRPDLEDVIFSGGLVRHGDGTATLYCGVSDAEAHSIRIPDPFAEYEKGFSQKK